MQTVKKTCTRCKVSLTFKVASKDQIKTSIESVGWISRPGLTLCFICKGEAEEEKRRKENREWQAIGPHQQFGAMWLCPKYNQIDYPRNGNCAFCERPL